MIVFYRKYRPQKVSELDLEIIRKKITIVLSSKRIPHAFLLTGPRGLGKTSVARIIAKGVNCLKKGKNGEPCGECEMCISISSGTNLDVLEIDAASHRGIDEIRDLREKVNLAPTKSLYKVYIIDEVHMLTMEAFNALLKTLEEPPAKTIFILCTTEQQKLPETIISRCLLFEFGYPAITELITSLERVVKGENLKVEEGVLEMIAKEARGSFRDAQKILDQLSLENNLITKQMVLIASGRNIYDFDDEILSFIAEKDTGRSIEWLNNKVLKGTNLKILTESLLDHFHKILLKKATGILPREKIEDDPLDKLPLTEIKKLISLFSRAYLEMKSTVIPELPLEIAIIEWGELQNEKLKIHPSTSLRARNEKLDGGSEGLEEKKKEVAEEKNISDGDLPKKFASLPGDILAVWPRVLAAIKPHNHSVEALLRSSRPLYFDKECLTIEVFYKFHKERLEQPKILELLSKTVSGVLEREVKVRCVLGERRTVSQRGGTADDELVKVAEEIFGK